MKPEVVCTDLKGRPVLYIPLPDHSGPGEVIRMDKHGQNFASADIARIRLRDVVARDREAVPCGRWVRKSGPPFEYLAYWLRLGFERPRYRYEVRR